MVRANAGLRIQFRDNAGCSIWGRGIVGIGIRYSVNHRTSFIVWVQYRLWIIMFGF